MSITGLLVEEELKNFKKICPQKPYVSPKKSQFFSYRPICFSLDSSYSVPPKVKSHFSRTVDPFLADRAVRYKKPAGHDVMTESTLFCCGINQKLSGDAKRKKETVKI